MSDFRYIAWVWYKLLAVIKRWLVFIFLWIPFKIPSIDLAKKNLTPSLLFWFGTDEMGRDLFQLIWPALQGSLRIGFLVAIINTMLGVVIGTFTVFLPQGYQALVVRLIDLCYTIPYLLLVLVLHGLLGGGLLCFIFSMCITGWILVARIARAESLAISEKPYVLAAKALGCSNSRLLYRYYFLNSRSSFITAFLLGIPYAIFTESFLSFLGIGLPSSSLSLGMLIEQGFQAIAYYPWRFFIPATVLSVTLLLIYQETRQ